jgi:hypothetical protein
MPIATWQLALTDLPTWNTTTGWSKAKVIDFLEKPAETTYVRRRSSYSEMSCTIRNKSDWHMLKGAPYRRALLGVRNGVARFWGQIVEHNESGLSGFTITAKDPYYRQAWRRMAYDLAYSALGDAEIAMRLIELHNGWIPAPVVGYSGPLAPSHSFLGRGTIETGTVRTRAFHLGQKLDEAIDYLVKLQDSFVFVVNAVTPGAASTEGLLGLFRSFAPFDTLKPTAIFQFGDKTFSNCDDYTRTVLPLTNKANIIGEDPLMVASALSVSGYQTYGLWEDERGQVNTSDEAVLKEVANKYVEDEPMYATSIVPGPTAPSLFTDYDVVNQVPVVIKNYGRTIAKNMSVDSVELTLDPDSGQEQVTSLVVKDPDVIEE